MFAQDPTDLQRDSTLICDAFHTRGTEPGVTSSQEGNPMAHDQRTCVDQGITLTRRDFVGLIAATTALPSVKTLAEASTRRPLIAVLLGGAQSTVQRWLGGFPDELQSLGYAEHRNYEAEYRYADGDLGQLPRLATELASLNPDVFVVGNTAAALAVKRAVPSTPIVVAAATNPVRFGLAASRDRPGGNVTGMLAGLETLAGKQLELGLQLLPGKKRIGMLVNANNVVSEGHRQSAEAAARAKAAELSWVTASTSSDIGKAITELTSRRMDYMIVPADAMFLSERQRIAELSLSARMPAVYAFREHVEAGGLISYGVDLREQFRRAARCIDRILKGAKPSGIPFEQPTKFELVLNARTAKTLGLTVPPALLERTDEVIE
jgi:putative tryptophan/tyrosine transport system substrate-binding protein